LAAPLRALCGAQQKPKKEATTVKITTRTKEGITILDLDGKLVLGDGDAVLRAQARDALDGGARKLLVNMQGVNLMDSSGLGELVGAQKTAQKLGGTLKLLHVQTQVHQVLEMARLTSAFETFDHEIDAIASFRR
jgi:anti-sigma B factor antagonist